MVKSQEQISVVVPCFNESEVIDAFLATARPVLDALKEDYEIIFVDDGSADSTLVKLIAASKQNERIKIISFSRNFGHQAAISAGIDTAQGDAIITIDSDLQDPPEIIPKLVSKWREGFEIVHAVRARRAGESLFKRLSAGLFYRLLQRISRVHIPVDTGDFRLIDRRVAEILKALPERQRYMRGLVAWTGFKQTSVKYERAPRRAGKTKYSLWRMMTLALDAITSFSVSPLRVAAWLAALTFFASIAAVGYALVTKFLIHREVPGWTSILVIMAFFSAMQFTILAILSEYVGRIYEELKRRPMYIVKARYGFKNNQDVKPED